MGPGFGFGRQGATAPRLVRLLLGLPLVCLAPAAGALDAEGAPQKSYAGEDFVIERQDRTVRFENDGTSELKATTRVHVLTDAGVREWGLIAIPYDAASESLDFKEVRVVRPSGEISMPSLAQLQEVTSPVALSAPVYSDRREKHFPVPDLRKDDELEFTTLVRVLKPQAPGQFWFDDSFVRAAIALEEELVVDVPSGRAVQLRTSDEVVPEIKEADGRRTYRFTHLSTSVDEVLLFRKNARRRRPDSPDVALSTFASWEDVGRWYSDLQRDRRVPTPEIRGKAAELARGATTDLEKIEAVYRYVAENVRYVGLALAMARVQAHPASETLANGYGDCKDKETLMEALLASLGIAAHPALVSSFRDIDEKVPYLQFDHVVTVIPQGEGDLWLDPTPPVAPFGWLSPPLRGQKALLVLSEGPSRLLSTPEMPAYTNGLLVNFKARLDETGALVGHEDTTLKGDGAVFLRTLLSGTPKDQWPQVFEKGIEKTIESASLKAEVKGGATQEALSAPQEIGWSADITIPSAANISGTVAQALLTLPDWSTHYPPSGDLRIRSDGQLNLPSNGTETIRVTIEAPSGWTPVPSSPTTLTEDFASYHSSYHVEGRSLVIERVLNFKTDRLPESRGPAFDEFRRELAKEPRVVALARIGATPAPVVKPTPMPDAIAEGERFYKTGIAAYEKRDYKGAVEAFKKALEANPEHASAGNELGRAYLGLHEADLAIAALEKQVRIAPAHLFAYNNLGLALRQAHRDDEAEAAFRKQIEVNPEDKFAHRNLGRLLLDKKRYEEAIPELQKAVALDPSFAGNQVNLGEAYLALDRDADAMATFEQVTSTSAVPQTWNSIAFALAEAGKGLPRAQQWAEAAVASANTRLRLVTPDRLASSDVNDTRALCDEWDTLGYVLLKRGDLEGARRYLEAAFGLNANPVLSDHLGEVYEALGQRDKAIHAYAMSLALAADRDESRKRLARLTGGEAGIAPAVSLAKAEAQGDLVLSVPRPAGLLGAASANLFVALLSEGKIAGAKVLEESPWAQAAAADLPGRPHPFAFPDATPSQAVRRATLACPASGDCELDLSRQDKAVLAVSLPPPAALPHVGGGVEAPRKTKNINPTYPQKARDAHIQGTVIIECRISPEGRVAEAKVLSGVPELNDAALEAVRQWEYTPTLLNGAPSPVIMTVTVGFSLR